jgi:NAD(P)-dependent dehydrogenase (short-subunit alcohol dehydrogenase family)
MTDAMPEGLRKAWRLEELTLGGGFGTAEQVAECIDFLASPAASFVTGVTLPVDGGFRLGYP